MTPRRLRAAIAATVAAVTLVLPMMVASPATAHSTQIGSTPAADSVLPDAPSEIVVEFDVPLIDMGTAMAVRGSDEQSIVTGSPAVDDRLLSVPVDPNAPADTYTVAYRVVSEDGHTITSTFQYTVAGGRAAPEPSATSSAVASPVASMPSTDAAEPGSMAPILVAGAALLLVIVGIAGAIALRR